MAMNEDDLFDTRFESKDIELSDNKVERGEDTNLLKLEPTLKKIQIGVGWMINTFDTDVVDLDVSVFLLNKNLKTQTDKNQMK